MSLITYLLTALPKCHAQNAVVITRLSECNSSDIQSIKCKKAVESLNIDIDTSHPAWSDKCHVVIAKVKIEKRHISYKKTEPPLQLNSSKNVSSNVTNSSRVCSFYYQNVRGLRTKCSDLFIASLACSYDIISLSETWLHSSIFDAELFHSDFVVYT